MSAFEEFLARVRTDVDRCLDELIPSAGTEPRSLHEAVRWSVFAGGKRVRPALVIAAGEVFGAEPDSLMRTAAAIEMLHTYSLIHDDLPAMDDDDMRRGKPTCHRQFGEATAILTGDLLQTLAFEVLAEDEGLDPSLRVRLISLVARAAGSPAGMIAGQQLDLAAEGLALAGDEIERIHGQKTGALITAAAAAGAIIGGADEGELEAIGTYARNIGLLFQITDDILDVTAPTALIGKTAGKDAAAAKATYPSHYGVERSREMAADMLAEACSALETLPHNTTLLRELAHEIASRRR